MQKEIKIYITYHEDSMISEYCLKSDDVYELFKGNDTNVNGLNINYLNRYYSELTTIYWVWKNHIFSNYVGFCHYRRIFTQQFEFDEGQCQVMDINTGIPVFQHYKVVHNYQDIYDAIDLLNEKYGENNKYSKYLLTSKLFIPYCCFIMRYSDFEKLCNWLFPILFAWDKKNGLNMDPQKYMEKAKKDFRYDDVNYQCRAVAFLAERLISCYLVTEMKPFCVTCL